jgi:hypothetical protein
VEVNCFNDKCLSQLPKMGDLAESSKNIELSKIEDSESENALDSTISDIEEFSSHD